MSGGTASSSATDADKAGKVYDRLVMTFRRAACRDRPDAQGPRRFAKRRRRAKSCGARPRRPGARQPKCRRRSRRGRVPARPANFPTGGAAELEGSRRSRHHSAALQQRLSPRALSATRSTSTAEPGNAGSCLHAPRLRRSRAAGVSTGIDLVLPSACGTVEKEPERSSTTPSPSRSRSGSPSRHVASLDDARARRADPQAARSGRAAYRFQPGRRRGVHGHSAAQAAADVWRARVDAASRPAEAVSASGAGGERLSYGRPAEWAPVQLARRRVDLTGTHRSSSASSTRG